MSLYQKYRPTTFDEMFGNQETVKNLRALTAKEDPPHVYLLTGPSGCGKTTLGRIIAISLGININDVLTNTGDYDEKDSASYRGIDTIRELRNSLSYVGLHGTRRVWLLDEIHQGTKDAANALLKGLEDPPRHAYFVLCTTEPDALLETTRSRCSIHKVAPLSEPDMVRLLHKITTAEGYRLARPQMHAIWEKTEGKPRAAINLLEKVLAADLESRDAVVAAIEEVKETTDSLARTLLGRKGWKAVATVLSQVAEDDVESVRRGVIGYCASILLKGENDAAMLILDQMIEPFFQSGKAGLVHACYLIVKG